MLRNMAGFFIIFAQQKKITMFLLDKDFKKEMRDRNVSIQELADYLVRNNTIYDLAMALSEYIIKDKERPSSSKIVVTEEEYKTITSLFRVKGFTASGEKDMRGRPKSVKEE